MTDPLEHIRHLAVQVGARQATKLGERRAAQYVQEQLERVGYDVKIEPFRAPSSGNYMYMVCFVISLAGLVAAGLGRPALGLLLSGIGLVAFIGESTMALRLASAIVPRGKTQNIVARMVPRELPRKRLVLTAHYDSPRSSLFFHPRLAPFYRPTFLLIVLSLIALPVLYGIETSDNATLLWKVSLPFAAVILYALLMMVHAEVRGVVTPGANDNASGVAVMLSLAEAVAQDAPEDTEVMAVATGAGETGMWGMQAFLRKHSDELDRAWIINLDNVGAGAIRYTTREGMLLPHRTGKALGELAGKVAATPGLAVTGGPFHAGATDSEPALLRGLEAITVIGLDGGLPRNWQWPSDTFENIDPDSVDMAYRFVEAMVRRLIA